MIRENAIVFSDCNGKIVSGAARGAVIIDYYIIITHNSEVINHCTMVEFKQLKRPKV